MENFPGYIPQPKEQFRYSFSQVGIWVGAIVLGVFLELMNWHGHALLILFGSGAMTGYNFIALLLLRGKNWMNNGLLCAGIVWILVLAWGVVANNGNPYALAGVLLHFGAIIFIGGLNALVYVRFFKDAI